ncbi:MAG: hypothetical protein IJX85_01630 [Lachnospiraceae bacterium]|nr:hypothetical protein [Lachnospiraceae bacterium]
MGVWADLGISSGTGILVLVAIYFVIKWAVKNGIKEAYSDITRKKTADEIEEDNMLKSFGYGRDNENDEELLEGI